MTQELYQNALKFAGEKHCDQTVPGTKANYLLHISNVAMEVLMAHHFVPDFDLNFAVQVAILHDTIEDTSTTHEELEQLFGSHIATGVQALTKNAALSTKQERMTDCLNRINLLEKEIGIVKLADRITNLQPPPSHWSKEKISNYLLEAMLIDRELAGKNAYLNARLSEKIEEYRKHE